MVRTLSSFPVFNKLSRSDRKPIGGTLFLISVAISFETIGLS
jgi:hypothetical protein